MRAIYVRPEIPEDAAQVVKEGLALRQQALLAGVCACGAVVQLPSREERRAAKRAGSFVTVHVFHEDGCAAASPELDAYLRGAR
jgi:hypothetical protein